MDDTPKKNPWGLVCYLMSSRVGLGDWHSPFLGISFERPSSHGGVVHLDPWVEGLVARGGRTGRSSPLGTHGNGTVWRGEINRRVDTWLRNCTIERLNNKVELGG